MGAMCRRVVPNTSKRELLCCKILCAQDTGKADIRFSTIFPQHCEPLPDAGSEGDMQIILEELADVITHLCHQGVDVRKNKGIQNVGRAMRYNYDASKQSNSTPPKK